jgi:transcription antitermination factor NusG
MAMAWYVVHTYSGFENKAKLALEERIKLFGLQARFSRVLVPTEEVVEVKNGRLAMIAMGGVVHQQLLTKQGTLEQLANFKAIAN